MEVISNPQIAYAHVAGQRQRGMRVGLVPTMGALHAGHISLVERARQECDYVVTTIFVNPTQFGPNEDFSRYPRTLESDLGLLKAAKADMVFTPAVESMYPPGNSTFVIPPRVSLRWKASFVRATSRCGHDRVEVVSSVTRNDRLLWQKDYQQCAVIRHMVDELNVPIRVEVCETIRESDGLAMSSRNRYLSATERGRALCLWKALQLASAAVANHQGTLRATDLAAIELKMRELLLREGADRIDYARIVDRETLETPDAVGRGERWISRTDRCARGLRLA